MKPKNYGFQIKNYSEQILEIDFMETNWTKHWKGFYGSFFWKFWVWEMNRAYKNLLKNVSLTSPKILDIGAGGGWIGEGIQKRKKTEISLLDVKDYNQTDLKLVLYNGENIPFSDNSFDVSLLIFALHHCLNFKKVLAEAKRVSKKKIIIIEDIPTSLINKIFLCLWDIVVNLPSLINLPGENISFNFKTLAQWQKIFTDLQLKIIFKKEFQSNKLIHHVLFVAVKL